MKALVFKNFVLAAFIFGMSMFTMDFSMQNGLTVSMQTAEARDGHGNRSYHGRHHRGYDGRHYNRGHYNRGHYNRGHYDYGRGYYGNYYRYRAPIGIGGAILIGSFFTTLPRNCYREYYYGRVYYHCGPNYYRRSGNGYIVVEAP